MSGLYKVDRERSFDVDGWFHTGDQGEVDGWRVHFRGRLGDMIKTAGANVAPSEVVAVLREQDGVQEAYVLGLPDPERGQVVAAAVVPAPGRTLDADELRQVLRQQLSVFKVPAHVVFFAEDEIPWTASHKVRTGMLAEMVAERAGVASPAKGR
jgi:acyl-CoA synthetase (AMP-forming)/AMP-acid ligase II